MKKDFSPTDRLSIFAFLWACYMLCQQEYYSNWLLRNSIDGWLLTGAIIAVLLSPRSLSLFLLMVILGGAERASRLPYAVNHLLIELFIDMALVGALVAVAITRKESPGFRGWWQAFRLTDDAAREQFFERMAPVLRLMYVIVYAFAFLSKLNYDFFNPAVSCGSVLYRDLLKAVPFLPTGNWVDLSVIWGTVLIEAALPLCFAFRGAWKYGLIIGIPFHIILGLAGHRTFSIQAFALYFLFISPAFTAVINDWRLRLKTAAGAWLAPLRVGTLALVLILMAIEIIGPLELRTMIFFRYSRMLIWLLWSVVVMVIFIAAIRRSSRMEAAVSPAPYRLGFLWVVPILVTLNGMSQYLGIKTEHSFTMFSNLRTEAGVNNHLFMPDWLKLSSLDTDVVEIIASDVPGFQFYRDHGLLLTYFEFKRMCSEIKGDFQVSYLHGGERRELVVRDGISSQPELMQAPPLWMAKLLRFRPISKSECMECFH